MKHHLCPTELKLITILFGLVIFLGGCSSTYTVSSEGKPNAEYTYRRMNEKLEGQHVRIELKGGTVVSAEDVTISEDSVSWVDNHTNRKSKASIQKLVRIVMNNHLLGSLEGLGFGLVGGGGIGALVGQVAIGDKTEWGRGTGAAIGLILGGGAGIIFGFTTGLIIGHTYHYEFPMTEQSDYLQNGK